MRQVKAGNRCGPAWLGWLLVSVAVGSGLNEANGQGAGAALLSPTAEEPTLPDPRPFPLGEGRHERSLAASLTLSDLENLALASNPTIAAAQALVDEERGLWLQIGLYPNPELGYVRSDASQTGQSQFQGVFIGQEFPAPCKRQLSRAIEDHDIRARLWQLQAQRERVLNDVRIQFFETLGAQRLVQEAQELEKLAVQGVTMAEKLFQAKVGSRTDVVRSEIQREAIRVTLQDAILRHQTAWKQLTMVMGRPGLPLLRLEGDLEAVFPQLDWDESLQKLLQESPVLQAQEAKVREAQAGWRRARVEPIPNLTVQVVAEHDRVQNFNQVTTLLAVPVPLFNRNQGTIAQAAANIRHEQKELERQQLALHDTLAVTFRQYLTARGHAERLKSEILPRVKENLDLTTKAGKQLGIFRLIEARQLYFETNLAYIDALTEMHKTAVEIAGMLLTGGLNPTEIGTALQARPGTAATGMRGLLLQQLQEQGSSKNRLLPGAIQGSAP